MEQVQVVLVGHNYNSLLGLARSLGREGYEISIIRTGVVKSRLFIRNFGKMPESKSKYVSRYMTASTKTDKQVIDILLNQFKPSSGKAVLFPVDDRNAEIIDLNYDRLEPFYYLPNVGNQQGGVVRLMDKYYQKQLAKSVGLPVPEGWSVKIENGTYEIPEDVTFPCFIKAEMPMGNRKKYMRKCDNREELEEALRNAASYRDCVMIIEEYVDIEKEYCIVGLCNKDKICIPEVIDEAVMGHGPHAGVTCYGKVLRPGFMSVFVEKLRLFLKSLNYQGLFTVDVFKCNGNYFFCELNLRIGGSGPSIIGAGVNIAKMYVEALEGKEIDEYNLLCNEISFASERPLLSDYSLGYISWEKYKEYLRKADYRFIYDYDDKRPYYSYGVTVLIAMLRRGKRTVRFGQVGTKVFDNE